MFEQFKRNIQPLINVYHLIKAVAANVIYGFPSRKLKVIGVTGTDGKTTTTFLIYHILRSLGKRVSMVSSIYAIIEKEEFSTGLHVTTPDALYVEKLLKKAVDGGDEYFVLETTSHALDQNRVWGVYYAIGVITNVTPEHLDYHKTYAKYLHAKTKLLLSSDISVINHDDLSFDQLSEFLEEKKKKFFSYGFRGEADFQFDSQKEIDRKISEFNNYNYLAAYAVASLLGFKEKDIIQSLKSFTLPAGRLEVVHQNNFTVLIDFAHTPNSIYHVLEHIKELYRKNGRLIHVFGSAGLRDQQKRSKMGQASAVFSDIVILTEEDYRTENPEKICREIAQGLHLKGFREVKNNKLGIKNKEYAVIINRKEAIKRAVSIARKGDVIVLTGKSHEQSLARGKKEYPWDEKRALLNAVRINERV